MDLNNLTDADVEGIFTDESHPLREKYRRGDPATKEAVTKMLARKHPGETDYSSNIVEPQSAAPASAPQTPPDLAVLSTPAPQQNDWLRGDPVEMTNAQIIQSLKAELGSGWEAVARTAHERVQQIADQHGLTLEQLDRLAHDVGIATDKDWQVNLIRRLGKK
jgi:hypothetical protein